MNTFRNEELRKTDPTSYEKVVTEGRRLTAEFQSKFGHYDAEAIVSVDKFRQDKGLNYPGNPPGLVDNRLVTTLKAAYFENIGKVRQERR